MFEAPGLPIAMGTVRVEPGLWETYLERGGRLFDTAWHYGPETEASVGALLERSGIREDVLLVVKGAHSPQCFPETVAPQLDESLERLRTRRADLYLLHRDNLDVPVGEFADALHREVSSGRVAAIGASNWTSERCEAFDEHARRHGLTPFSAVSNQLSLAQMQVPVWENCLRADVGWHESTQTPLLAWSAQARGFFAGRSWDEEMRASWVCPANLERARRARELAAVRGVAPVAIALAWVIARPFPVCAVVGPRTPAELDNCLAAASLDLTPAESRRLDLTDGSAT